MQENGVKNATPFRLTYPKSDLAQEIAQVAQAAPGLLTSYERGPYRCAENRSHGSNQRRPLS